MADSEVILFMHRIFHSMLTGTEVALDAGGPINLKLAQVPEGVICISIPALHYTES